MPNKKSEPTAANSEFELAEKQIREYSPTPSPIIDEWGPQETVAGKGFNVQADGTSTLWFRVRRFNSDVVARINDNELGAGFFDPKTNIYSVSLPQKYYANPGVFEVLLIDKKTGKKSNQEFLVVRAS